MWCSSRGQMGFVLVKAMKNMVYPLIFLCQAPRVASCSASLPIRPRPTIRGWSSKASGAAIQRNRDSFIRVSSATVRSRRPEVTHPAIRFVSARQPASSLTKARILSQPLTDRTKTAPAISRGDTDPSHPFTQRGRRAIGHLIGDIATEDPHLIGRGFGIFSGVAMGIALPKDGLDFGLGTIAIPAILGFIAGELGARGLPLLNGLARKHGFLPTISLGGGSNFGLGLGVGFEKRDRPLPLVPVNTYLTFGFDSSLAVTGGPGASSTFLAKVGVRIDPGKQGGLFALGSVGAGLAVGSDVSGATSAELGAGIRATDFLDVQLVRETVSGGGGGDATYWLTLKLVAPQRVLKGH